MNDEIRPDYGLEDLKSLLRLNMQLEGEGDLMTVDEVYEVLREDIEGLTIDAVSYRLGVALRTGKVVRGKVRRVRSGSKAAYVWGYKRADGSRLVPKT